MTSRHYAHHQSLALAAVLSLLLLGGFGSTASADESVYRQFGGEVGMTAVVDRFVERLLDHAELAPAFENTSIPRLKAMLTAQFCELTGGPCTYEGRDMRSAHRGMDITEREFNLLAEELQIAMEESGVPFSAQNKLLAKLAPMHRDIVDR